MTLTRARRIAVQAQFLVEGRGWIGGCLRFLEVVTRGVQRLEGDRYMFVHSLLAGGTEHLPWEEGRVREVPLELVVEDGLGARYTLDEPELIEVEPIEEAGARVGRWVRTRRALRAIVHAEVERASATRSDLYRVTIRVENAGPGPSRGSTRAQVMSYPLASTHLLLEMHGGVFLSLAEPPPWAQPAAAGCVNVGVRPMVVSDARELLCSPILQPEPYMLEGGH